MNAPEDVFVTEGETSGSTYIETESPQEDLNEPLIDMVSESGRFAALKKLFFSKSLKNLVSFWLLGVGIDFGFWAILTAAHDLISKTEEPSQLLGNSTGRECNHISSGVILVVNIVPNLVMKVVLPFMPLWIHTRTFMAILTSVVGFALAAFKQTEPAILTGVALSSISVGIGESTYLMYIPYFKDKKIVSAWSSGTGFSGFLSSLTYLALIDSGVSLSTTLYIMISAPIIMGLVFWFLLDHPEIREGDLEPSPEEVQVEDPTPVLDHVTAADATSLVEKFKILYRLSYTYTLPFFLVFLLQSIINQGLFELLYFKNSFLDLASYVRWFNFIYLVPLLFARSAGSLKIDYLWSMVFLQAANLVLLTTQSIYGWMGYYGFWIVAAIVLGEGLISGFSYINTYRKINAEVPVDQRQFAMSINSVGASLGMLLAGIIAIPVHNYICDLPVP